jgi:hypothetical protein
VQVRLALFFLLCAGGVASAQGTFVEADEEARETPKADIRGRISASGVAFTESAPQEMGADPENGDAATDSLLYTDLRGRIDIRKLAKGWALLGDVRLRLAPSDTAARGYLGGNEIDVREVNGGWRGQKLEIVVGRQIVQQADALTVDGLTGLYRIGTKGEVGIFGGLFPNPFSRSLSRDYDAGMPLTGGAWGGYRTEKIYGTVAAAVIAPRGEEDTTEEEPLRAFVTSSGYLRLSKLNVFHYLVLDLKGQAGFSLMNAQLGATYMATPKLRLEAGVSYLGTYALRLFLRDLLEDPNTPPPTGTVGNNLVLARTGSIEGRLGATYSFPEQRIDLFANTRLRRRALINPIGGTLDPTVTEGSFDVDLQLDASGGVRFRKTVLGLGIQLAGGMIRGDRSSVNWGALRIGRLFLDDRLEIQLDGSFLGYADQCVYDGMMAENPTCTGQATGLSLEIGLSTVFLYTRRWLFLADYRLGRQSPQEAGVAEPTITNHTVFLRAQYSF